MFLTKNQVLRKKAGKRKKREKKDSFMCKKIMGFLSSGIGVKIGKLGKVKREKGKMVLQNC